MLDTTRTEDAAAASGDLGQPVKTLLDLGPMDCRWPSGHHQIVFICGQQRVDKLPYCVCHCRIAYRPGGR